jgi:hypothetical protein
MNELRYYISALYYSLFSRRFYADLIANKRMLGFRYLLILAVIAATPISFEIKYIISKIFPPATASEPAEESIDFIKKQVPPLYIENNKLRIEASTNQSIVSRSGSLLAIFDVENKIDDLEQYDKILIVGQDTLRLKLPDNQGTAVIMTNEIFQSLKPYFMESGQGEKFDTSRFFDDMVRISQTPLPVIIMFSSFWYLAIYMFSALAYSFAAGLLLTIICKKTSFDFRQCFRIAVFTATPVALLEAISNISGEALFSFASLVYFATHILYIHFAIESYKRSNLK